MLRCNNSPLYKLELILRSIGLRTSRANHKRPEFFFFHFPKKSILVPSSYPIKHYARTLYIRVYNIYSSELIFRRKQMGSNNSSLSVLLAACQYPRVLYVYTVALMYYNNIIFVQNAATVIQRIYAYIYETSTLSSSYYNNKDIPPLSLYIYIYTYNKRTSVHTKLTSCLLLAAAYTYYIDS